MRTLFGLDLSAPPKKNSGLSDRRTEDGFVYIKNLILNTLNIKGSRFRVINFFALGDVQCFGEDCYALAFGVPGLLMVIALGEYSRAKET